MFEITYDPLDGDYGWIHFIVRGKDISKYTYKNAPFYGICRIDVLIEWFNSNLKYILSDDEFPVRTFGDTGADKWLNSDIYIPVDKNKSMIFHENRQQWLWHHSIETCKQEFCIPFIVFQKVKKTIEISWNNSNHNYIGVNFLHNKGECYINIDKFELTIKKFIEHNS